MENVLIVDDERSNLEAYRRALELEMPHLNVDTADSEEVAIDSINKKEYDIVITDLAMKDAESGMRVLMHAKIQNPLSMVILVTAHSNIMDRYAAFENGAFECIAKSTPGLKTNEEIVAKTKTALYFLSLIKEKINYQQQVDFLKRYFDKTVFSQIETNKDVLNLRNRTITVVFWDIRGFSMACETLKAHPKAISDFLKEYFDLASKVIFKYGGVVDKFIGDGVMALFGSLEERTDVDNHASKAAAAALELKKEFSKLLAQWMQNWQKYTAQQIDLGLGCGIHSGECLVGNVGSEIRDQYTALGTNVNLASRIEARTTKEQILLTVSTESRIRDKFICELREKVDNIKNIPGSYQLYELISEK